MLSLQINNEKQLLFIKTNFMLITLITIDKFSYKTGVPGDGLDLAVSCQQLDENVQQLLDHVQREHQQRFLKLRRLDPEPRTLSEFPNN